MSSIPQIGPVCDPLISRLRHRFEEGLGELKDLVSSLGPYSKPKQIHDIRIATRRLRVLCRLMAQVQDQPEAFKGMGRALKALAQSLSSVRSWDVSAQSLKGIERHWKVEGKRGLGFLRKIVDERVRQVRKENLSHLPKDLFFKELDPLQAASSWNRVSVAEVEQALLNGVRKCSNKALKRWDNYRKSGDITNLHQFRISVKRLRYFLEIQVSGLANPTEEKVKRFKSMQDRLGYIHDLYVLRDHLEKKAVRRKVPSDKKSRYHRVQKFLTKSLSGAIRDFQKNESGCLSSLLQGDLH